MVLVPQSPELEPVVKSVPEIIKQASQSPLGILALLIIVLFGLDVYFFRTAPVRWRGIIFIVFFGGVVGYAWEINRRQDCCADLPVTREGKHDPCAQAGYRGQGAGIVCKSTCGGRFQNFGSLTFNYLGNGLLHANVRPHPIGLTFSSPSAVPGACRQQSKLSSAFEAYVRRPDWRANQSAGKLSNLTAINFPTSATSTNDGTRISLRSQTQRAPKIEGCGIWLRTEIRHSLSGQETR